MAASVLASAAFLAVAGALPAPSAPHEDPTVRTIDLPGGGKAHYRGSFIGGEKGSIRFAGVRYAKEPTGQLRWAAPETFTPADGSTTPATELAANCMQSVEGGPAWETMNESVSEDCLFLNVWMPHSEQEVITTKLPVCVYIHGGGYAYGGANDLELDGFALSNTADCVAVTLQYRLGVFGFLGAESFRSASDGSTGNWGIQDQRLALKWVHANIEAFHGDRDRIMIFGESAGAGAVSNHVAMKKSWPYFRNAAMQSGGFQQWVAKSVAQASSNFEAFAARMGCTQKNTGVAAAAAVRDCLVAAPVKKIVDVSTGGVFPHDDSWTACRWAPTVDGVELDAHPMLILKAGKAHPNASLILGTNADEGTDFIGYNRTGSLPHDLPHNLTKAGFAKWAGEIWGAGAPAALEALYPVPQQYAEYWNAAQRVVGDYMMTCPNRRFAQWRSAAGTGAGTGDPKTFVYLFDELPGTIPARRGVFHGAEIRFVFFDSTYLVGWDEKELSIAMLRFWSNLAASGDVNLRGDKAGGGDRDVAWPPYAPATHKSIHFDADGSYLEPDLHDTQCDYFDSLEPGQAGTLMVYENKLPDSFR